jgi:hypothetical protein
MFSGAETIKNRRNYWLESFNNVLNLTLTWKLQSAIKLVQAMIKRGEPSSADQANVAGQY